jgi:hypothetical protein
MIYAAIISLIAAIIINYFNNLKDARNGHINHTRAWKIKALSCISSVILFTLYKTGYHLLMEWTTLWASGKSILLTGAWFMFLFNMAWGLKVANDPFYRSTAVGKNLPWSDKLFLHWPKWLYILFMLVLVSGATIIYFL